MKDKNKTTFADAIAFVCDNTIEEKVNINDFRIGNYAQRESQPDGFLIDEMSLSRIEFGAKDYHPIKLNRKWLERLGLRKLITIKDCYEFDLYKYWIYNIKSKCVYNMTHLINEPMNNEPIIYVHQLQNLYYHHELIMLKRVK